MNLSANNASRRLQMNSGYERVAVYSTFQRGVFAGRSATRSIVSRAYRRLKRTIGAKVAITPFREFDVWAAQTKPPIVGSTQPRYAEMSALVSRCNRGSKISLVRDERFYRWRLSNPAAQYRFIYYESDNGSLDGFVIVQQPKYGQRTTIIDWASSNRSTWIDLAAAAVEGNLEHLVISSTSFSNVQRRTLTDLGFQARTQPDTIDVPAPGMLLHAPAADSTADGRLGGLRAFDTDSWDVRMIASDAF